MYDKIKTCLCALCGKNKKKAAPLTGTAFLYKGLKKLA